MSGRGKGGKGLGKGGAKRHRPLAARRELVLGLSSLGPYERQRAPAVASGAPRRRRDPPDESQRAAASPR